MSHPLVSVVMPVHNGGKYIRDAVESVFAQEVPLNSCHRRRLCR